MMIGDVIQVGLTRPQMSVAIVALKEYINFLQNIPPEQIEGGEHEDALLAGSVIKALAEARKE